MEVHHHSHTADPGLQRGKKKWTHYFWEFLMLFLAVFCGFLAEYKLEHTIEHQREKQYAGTLYADVKADTTALMNAITANLFVTSRIDTFRTLVQTQSINSIPAGNWYYYGRFGTRYFHIPFQDATIEQLKSSGGLRYFRSHDVVKAIARYDQTRRDLQILLKFQDPFYSELVKSRNIVFNAYYLDELMDFDRSAVNIDSFKLRSIPLLSNKKEDFIQYANFCQIRSYNNKYLLRSEQEALKHAEILLAELKDKYNFK
ncbi:MAG TPA: hypothetical protein VFP97_01210 [Chitinophagaceae bacterium]|nr:hypothetical protein [Chitinophagaceae bacterium]